MTYVQYLELARRSERAYSEWRRGQAYVNVLSQWRPWVAERLRGTDVDPFYSNEKIPAFLEAVIRLWDTEPEL